MSKSSISVDAFRVKRHRASFCTPHMAMALLLIFLVGTGISAFGQYAVAQTRETAISSDRTYDALIPDALAGDANCQFRIGLLYLFGIGKPLAPDVAANWFRRAAASGHGSAQSMLGSMYLKGDGLERDVRKATYWLMLAGEQSDSQALLILAGLFAGGQLGPSDMEKAMVFLRRAAEQISIDSSSLHE
jgi:TPR repeat protein